MFYLATHGEIIAYGHLFLLYNYNKYSSLPQVMYLF